jgi:hypothetical protein
VGGDVVAVDGARGYDAARHGRLTQKIAGHGIATSPDKQSDSLRIRREEAQQGLLQRRADSRSVCSEVPNDFPSLAQR